VALEDLARLLLALESDEPWGALRGARIQQLDGVYERLADDVEAARGVFQLPSPESLEASDLSSPAREAMLDASEAMARRWHQQLVGCASAWLLLRQLAKAMRHGSPLLPRELVEEPPGAGDLAAGVQPVEGRWVMLIPTQADAVEPPYTTERALADLRDETLRRARQAGLDGVALARVLASLHVTRLDTSSLIALPNEALSNLDPAKRRLLKDLSRG
jgi:hypothetical protein